MNEKKNRIPSRNDIFEMGEKNTQKKIQLFIKRKRRKEQKQTQFIHLLFE